jgi:plastocyanin
MGTKIQIASVTALAIAGSLTMLAQAPAPPGTSQDRVGFPAGYKNTFTKLTTIDRDDNGQIRMIWGNELARNTPWWTPYPYGSVLVFESWTSKRDAQGALIYDENGRLVPDTLTNVFTQRKQQSFGSEYGPNRNGEWEFMNYLPDGTPAIATTASGACAVCHLQSGPQNDYVFRRSLFPNPFNPDGSTGASPIGTISQYRFYPREITIKKNTAFTWKNDDEVVHTIFVPGTGFFSGPMFTGATTMMKIDTPGTYDIRCTLHAACGHAPADHRHGVSAGTSDRRMV